MREAEFGSVEKQTGRSQNFSAKALGVHTLTDEWMARFRQVNADLVRAPSLEPALDQRNRAPRFDAAHVRDGLAPQVGILGRAAQTVASILNQATVDGARLHRPVRDGHVPALRRVKAKLGF